MPDWITPTIIISSLGLLVAILTLIYRYLILPKKELTFQVFKPIPLLSINERIQNKVKIFYETSEIQQLHYYQIKFTSSGNKDIAAADFADEITITHANANPMFVFDENIETSENMPPPPVSPNYVISADSGIANVIINIKPFTFTKGRSFTIRYYLAGEVITEKITATITNGKFIPYKTDEGGTYLGFFTVFLLAIVALFSGMAFGPSVFYSLLQPGAEYKITTAASFVVIILIVAITYNNTRILQKYRKQRN